MNKVKSLMGRNTRTGNGKVNECIDFKESETSALSSHKERNEGRPRICMR